VVVVEERVDPLFTGAPKAARAKDPAIRCFSLIHHDVSTDRVGKGTQEHDSSRRKQFDSQTT
jgi:hypothetical protein